MKPYLRSLRQEIAAAADSREISDDVMLCALIDETLTRYGREEQLSLSEKTADRQELIDSFRGMDLLQPLLDDEEITEIMVNGPGSIFVEKNSELYCTGKHFEEKETLEDVIQVLAAGVNRVVNTSSPIADLRMPDTGYRINVVLPPAAPDGPVMTIRKFSREALTMERLLELGSLSRAAADFLGSAVRVGCNIFISGGTGSGKTSFLNALSSYIPPEERVITIEDSLELRLQGLPDLVRLETRQANLEGENAITIRDLIRTALRMRPSRIIVGEVRGAEALDMLQAMNTGHRGSLSTGHANSCRDMLSRLETMALMADGKLPLAAVRAQIASALDLIVHLGRTADRKRRVLAVEEVLDYEGDEIRTRPIFLYRRDRGLVPCTCQPENTDKWQEFYGASPFFDREGRLHLPEDEEAPADGGRL